MALTSDYDLSSDQQAAVDSGRPAIVVVASAGSGKTEVVARRVERLLTAAPSEAFRVLALSYTVKAADELQLRFSGRLGGLGRRVDTETVHRFAHSLLRQHGTRIGLPVEPEVLVRDEDRVELLTRWLAAEGHEAPDDPRRVLQSIDVARARLEEAPFSREWEAALASVGAVDYGSMLVQATELLGLSSARRQLARLYAHIIVDEAQNLTAAQYGFLTALIGPPSEHVPTMMVGDDKQSIVSFAGADPRLIGRFAEEYKATRFELRKNFRSAAEIVEIGKAVASDLGQGSEPDAEPIEYAALGSVQYAEAPDESAEGSLVADWVVDLLENGLPEAAVAPGESRFLRPAEIAVLARAAATLRPTSAALQAAGQQTVVASSPEDWLSTLTGKTALEVIALRSAASHRSTHWQLSRLLGTSEAAVETPEALSRLLERHEDAGLRRLAPLCAAASPADFIAELTGLGDPPSESESLADWEADSRQLTDAWQQFVEQTDRVEQTWGNFRLHVSRVQRGDDTDPGVRALTIHRAQGREYRAVALVGLNDGQLPDFRATDGEQRIAELRAFYVAITRPSRMLLLTRAAVRGTRYGARMTEPSPFLRYLPK